MLDKNEINKIEFSGAESVKAFVKKYNSELKKVFSKDFKTLDKEDINFSELMDKMIEEARNTGIEGREIYKLLKNEFNLNYKDLDKVLVELKTRLVPDSEEDNVIDIALKKREEYIKQIIAEAQVQEQDDAFRKSA
jgi:hypothetical protein